MNSTFTLDTEEAQLLFLTDLVYRTRCVVIADADVTMLPQRVIGQIVLREIAMHICVTPVGDRMNLPALA